MSEQEAIAYSVYVGIDWADSKHDVCIQSKSSDEREFAVVRHRPEADPQKIAVHWSLTVITVSI